MNVTDGVDLLLGYLKKEKSTDLASYRKTFLSRRLNVRMDAVGVNNVEDYIKVLEKDSHEWYKFIDNLSINVSEFFRDPEVYLYFKDICVPELLARKKKLSSNVIRCWSCGCSCGEETYSLAMLFQEYLGRDTRKFLLRIHGTDVDEDALNKAKNGIYTKQSLGHVGQDLLEQYFKPLPNGSFQVTDTLKNYTIFRKHNLLTDSPPQDMDAVFFRNVRIYFNSVNAEKVLIDIYNALKQNCYLILGKVETVGTLKNLFEPISINNKIFRKI